MNVKIDRSGCIGCGVCSGICPTVFEMAEDGLADVCGEVTSENIADAKEAESNCPVSVISVLE